MLAGFTITRFGWSYSTVVCKNASPKITNCTFSYNFSEGSGAAISNTGSSTIVSNCTFFRNSVTPPASYPGGGAIYNSGGLTITGSTFIRNDSRSGGGAIRNSGSLRIINCVFSNNVGGEHIAGGRGGGAICNNGSLFVSNSTFTENVIDCIMYRYGGGAISNYSTDNPAASATITDSSFFSNHAWCGPDHGNGGAILSNSSATITNCLFSGNWTSAESGSDSGAIFASNSTITNCTFTGNWAFNEDRTDTSSISIISASNSTITNCILWGNRTQDGSQIVADASTVVKYSDIEGGYAGEGNIDKDPLFVDSGYWDDNGTFADFEDDIFVSGDYHLRKNSPCIDAGTSENAPDTDIDGDARPQGAGYEMGAYEYVIFDDGGGSSGST